MSMIEKKNTRSRITRFYKVDQFRTHMGAINWLSCVRKIDGFKTAYISYDVTDNDPNKTMDGQATTEAMEQAYKDMDMKVDFIFIKADFDGKPVIVGVDMNKLIVYVITHMRKPADIDKIEELLHLV